MRKQISRLFLSATLVAALAACSDGGEDADAFAPAFARGQQGGDRTGVRSLVVSPETASLSAGESLALQVTITDRKGAVSPDRAAWTSTAQDVADVDGAGKVTAISAGSAAVVASWRNVADTAWITVTGGEDPPPPPPPASLVTECDAPAPEWIWCDDFEQNRLAAYFEHERKEGAFDRTTAVGLEGSAGMRASWNSGQVSVGWLHLAFGRTPSGYFTPVDEGTATYREIYWRFFVRYDADWSGGGGFKMTRARIFHAEEGWVQAMAAPVWAGDGSPDVISLDPVSYTDAAGDLTGSARWLGQKSGVEPIFADRNVGPWYCVEARVRLNDAGAANGEFQAWIDGQLDAQRTGLNWVGSYDAFGINVVTLDNYWNGGAPQAQSRYFDNLVVSTAPIGCG
ncbi:MAG: Ig-like domain-containing protein [Gemmatimonadota bacterium]